MKTESGRNECIVLICQKCCVCQQTQLIWWRGRIRRALSEIVWAWHVQHDTILQDNVPILGIPNDIIMCVVLKPIMHERPLDKELRKLHFASFFEFLLLGLISNKKQNDEDKLHPYLRFKNHIKILGKISDCTLVKNFFTALKILEMALDLFYIINLSWSWYNKVAVTKFSLSNRITIVFLSVTNIQVTIFVEEVLHCFLRHSTPSRILTQTYTHILFQQWYLA